MDIASTTTFNTNSNTPTAKSPDQEPEPAQTRPIQSPKPQSLTNGVLKRNSSLLHHHHHHRLSAPTPVVITYKECLKNHAAALGGHALDGCGEFMPSPTATHTDPTSLKCAACGCHRNFHRRDPEDPGPHPSTTIEYQSHHRHHPPPPPSQIPPPYRSPNSSSPPPISSAYPSAPHMLLALSTGLTDSGLTAPGTGSSSRKRFRTKFSQTQKEKMYEFAEQVGWKMQKRDEELVQDFCNRVGVDRTVFKVWMHNNKTTLGKKDMNGDNDRANVVDQSVHGPDHQHFENHGLAAHNGSSSSS